MTWRRLVVEHYWKPDSARIKKTVATVTKRFSTFYVKYHLKIPEGKTSEAQEAFSVYLVKCPAAQSVIGCINIQDELVIDKMIGHPNEDDVAKAKAFARKVQSLKFN